MHCTKKLKSSKFSQRIGFVADAILSHCNIVTRFIFCCAFCSLYLWKLFHRWSLKLQSIVWNWKQLIAEWKWKLGAMKEKIYSWCAIFQMNLNIILRYSANGPSTAALQLQCANVFLFTSFLMTKWNQLVTVSRYAIQNTRNKRQSNVLNFRNRFCNRHVRNCTHSAFHMNCLLAIDLSCKRKKMSILFEMVLRYISIDISNEM